MNLHEFQGKQILSSYGVGIQRGMIATTPDEAVTAAKQLTGKQVQVGTSSKHKFTLVDVVKVEV